MNDTYSSLRTKTSVHTEKETIHPFSNEAVAIDPYEVSWRLPEEIGHGIFKKISFQPGFDLYMMDCRVKQACMFKAAAKPSVICLRFNILGQNAVKVHPLNKTFTTTSQENSLFYFNNPESSGKIAKGQCLCGVSVHLDPCLLISLLDKEHFLLPGIEPIASGKNIPYFSHTGPTLPHMQTTLHQIVNCPYQGAIKRIFLESKALELLACKLEQMQTGCKKYRSDETCTSADIERVCHAGHLLIQNMDKPPSLAELGRAVGLSRTKLHVEFCKYYGIPPFAYLRNARLNQAKQLLDEGAMNVTQVAMAIGYVNLSHFAKAFRQYFGVAPGHYLQDIRSKAKKQG